MQTPDWIESAAVYCVMFVGSADDLMVGPAGIYHLLEHVLFRGTAKFANNREIKRPLLRHAGRINAFTTHEMTASISNVPLSLLDQALDRQVDLFGQPKLRQSDMEHERHVIHTELVEHASDMENWIGERACELQYGKEHPFSHSPGGTHKSLDRVTYRQLLKAYAAGYSRNRMIVVATSKLTPGTLLRKIAPHLKRIPERDLSVTDERRRNAFYGEAPSWKTGGVEKIVWPFSGARVTVAFQLEFGPFRDVCRWNFFMKVLNGSTGSPMHQVLREKRKLVYGVDSLLGFTAELSRVGVTAQVREQNIYPLLKAFWDVFEDPKLITRDRVDVVRDTIRGSKHMRTLNPLGAVGDAVNEIAVAGHVIPEKEYLDIMLGFDVDELRTIQSQLTRPKARTIIFSKEHA